MVARIERIFATNTESLKRLEGNAEVGRSLSLTAHLDALHVDDCPSVVFRSWGGDGARRGECLTLLIIRITDYGIRIPLPIAHREHRIDLEPLGRTRFEFGLNTHVAGIYAGHVHVVVGLILVRERARLGHRLVHPLGEIRIHVERYVFVVETITDFYGSNLLILGVVVERVTHVRRHEEAVEFRLTSDETCVDEEVVVTVEIVVYTTLNRAAELVSRLRALVVFVVVETIHAPVVVARSRSVDEGRELIHAVFE